MVCKILMLLLRKFIHSFFYRLIPLWVAGNAPFEEVNREFNKKNNT